jgi:hypothetical protein
VLFDGVELSDNIAAGPVWAYGGGAVVWQNGVNDVSWVDTTVSGNTVFGERAIGGGAFWVGLAGSTTTVSSSTVDGNGTYDGVGALSGFGGGMYYSTTGSTVIVEDTTVTRNASTSGGGLEAYLDGGVGMSVKDGSVVDGNTGHGLLFWGVDALSAVDLVDSRVTGNTGSGVYMLSGSTTGSATLTCTGNGLEAAGMYGNGGDGVTGDCSLGGACTFRGTSCDLADPSTRVGNAGAAVHLYDEDWDFLVDATFWCDGTICR